MPIVSSLQVQNLQKTPRILSLLENNIIKSDELLKLQDFQMELLRDPIILELLEENKISFEEILSLSSSETDSWQLYQDIIQNPIILQRLKNDKINLYQMLRLCDYQSEILKNKIILSLLKNDKINLDQLLNLGLGGRKEVLEEPIILRLIEKNEIQFADIVQLSQFQIKVAQNASILNFLQCGKIKFDEVVQLSQFQAEIITDLTMLEFLGSGKIKLSELLKLQEFQEDLMEEPVISNLLSGDKIKFTEMLQLSELQTTIILNPNILRLLENNKITLDEVLQLSAFQTTIVVDPIILSLLAGDKIKLTEVFKLTTITQTEALKLQTICEILKQNDLSLSLEQLKQINQYQIAALTQPKISTFLKDTNGEINFERLLKIHNNYQVDIFQAAHIVALLQDEVIKPEQLLQITTESAYRALINPLIAKMLRDKSLTFTDIMQSRTKNISHCLVTLDEFLLLCSGNRKTEQVPLWFKTALHDRGIKLLVIDANFGLGLSVASIDGPKHATNIFNEGYLNERQGFGSECTMVALSSDNQLLGSAVLKFTTNEVMLEYLASVNLKGLIKGRLEKPLAFSYIGSFLFAASTLACIREENCGKKLILCSIVDAFYNKFADYGVTRSLGSVYTTKTINSTAEIIPGRDFFKKLLINMPVLGKQALLFQVLSNYKTVSKQRSWVLRDIDVMCIPNQSEYQSYLIHGSNSAEDISNWRKSIADALKNQEIADNAYIYRYDSAVKSLLFIYVQDGMVGKVTDIIVSAEDDSLANIIQNLDLQNQEDNSYQLLSGQDTDILTARTINTYQNQLAQYGAVTNDTEHFQIKAKTLKSLEDELDKLRKARLDKSKPRLENPSDTQKQLQVENTEPSTASQSNDQGQPKNRSHC